MIDMSESQVVESVAQEKETESFLHNFQKHLVLCLRRIVEVKFESGMIEPYHKVAFKLWKQFKKSNCCNKKILHFLLGENNEHPITTSSLKKFDLLAIYQQEHEDILREARIFLSKEVLRQVTSNNVETYLLGRKLKSKARFAKYFQFFLEELRAGCLKRRMLKSQILTMSSL